MDLRKEFKSAIAKIAKDNNENIDNILVQFLNIKENQIFIGVFGKSETLKTPNNKQVWDLKDIITGKVLGLIDKYEKMQEWLETKNQTFEDVFKQILSENKMDIVSTTIVTSNKLLDMIAPNCKSQGSIALKQGDKNILIGIEQLKLE